MLPDLGHIYMICLGRKGATEKNRFFFIPDIENTRSELSYVIKSDPVANVQNGLKSVTKKFVFLKFTLAVQFFVFVTCENSHKLRIASVSSRVPI